MTSGLRIKMEERKLNYSFQTTVLPHLQVAMADSLLNQNTPFYNFFINVFQQAFCNCCIYAILHYQLADFHIHAGLETYVQEGTVNDKNSAKEFVVQQLSQNIFYTDAALLSLAYDAACNNDLKTIFELDEICTAVKLPREIRLASNKLGIRLLKIFENNEGFILPKKYKD